MSTTRLLSKPMQTRFTEEQLEKMERPELMNAFAQAVAEGRDKPAAETDKPHSPPHYDPAAEKVRLEFEEEIRLRREEIEHHTY
jgi:hypothetical protein